MDACVYLGNRLGTPNRAELAQSQGSTLTTAQHSAWALCATIYASEQLAHLWQDHPVGTVGAAAVILAHLGVEASRCRRIFPTAYHLALALWGGREQGLDRVLTLSHVRVEAPCGSVGPVPM